MCVRTKTTYGCGHTFKTTNPCESRRCKGVERWPFEKDGDCRDCKAGGAKVTRGQEGLGRYAREHMLQESVEHERRQPLSDVSSNTADRRQPRKANTAPAPTSPWMPHESVDQDKKLWSTSVRREADSAWLREHAERQSVPARTTPDRDSNVESRKEPRGRSPISIPREKPNYDSHTRTEVIEIPSPKNRPERPRQHRYDSFESFPSTSESKGEPRKHSTRVYDLDQSPPRYEYRDPHHARPPLPRRPKYTYSMYSSSPSPYEGNIIEVRAPIEIVSPKRYRSYGHTSSSYDSGFRAGGSPPERGWYY